MLRYYSGIAMGGATNDSSSTQNSLSKKGSDQVVFPVENSSSSSSTPSPNGGEGAVSYTWGFSTSSNGGSLGSTWRYSVTPEAGVSSRSVSSKSSPAQHDDKKSAVNSGSGYGDETGMESALLDCRHSDRVVKRSPLYAALQQHHRSAMGSMVSRVFAATILINGAAYAAGFGGECSRSSEYHPLLSSCHTDDFEGVRLRTPEEASFDGAGPLAPIDLKPEESYQRQDEFIATTTTDPAQTFKENYDLVKKVWLPVFSFWATPTPLAGFRVFDTFLNHLFQSGQTNLPALLERFANRITHEVQHVRDQEILGDARGLILRYQEFMKSPHAVTEPGIAIWLNDSAQVMENMAIRITEETCDSADLPRLAATYNILTPLRALALRSHGPYGEIEASDDLIRKLIDINQTLIGPFTFSPRLFSKALSGVSDPMPYNLPSYARVLGKLHVGSGSSWELADMPLLKDLHGLSLQTPAEYFVSPKHDCGLLREAGHNSEKGTTGHRGHQEYDRIMQTLWESNERARKLIWGEYDLGHMYFLLENDHARGSCLTNASGHISLEFCDDSRDEQKWQFDYERYDSVKIKNGGECLLVFNDDVEVGSCENDNKYWDVRGASDGATLRTLTVTSPAGSYPSSEAVVGVYPQKGGYDGVVVWQSTNVGVEVPRALRWRIFPTGRDEELFIQPKNGEYRLDWCRVFGRDCGEITADDFCRTKGFSGVASYGADYPVQETKTLLSNEVCRGERCGSFTHIYCSGAAGGVYSYPRLGEHRLDWCWQFGKRCGKDAAVEFCERKGYASAETWRIDLGIGSVWHPTETIGTGELCNSSRCGGFAYIQCGGSPSKVPYGFTTWSAGSQ